MQIVISIPDEEYELVRHGNKSYTTELVLMNAVANGTPLPIGHGRLIDADELKRTMEKDKRRALSFVDLTDFVWLAQTIIEANVVENEE